MVNFDSCLSFSRQWPATFCNDHTCTHKPPKRYNVRFALKWLFKHPDYVTNHVRGRV